VHALPHGRVAYPAIIILIMNYIVFNLPCNIFLFVSDCRVQNIP
jgi:hypothetical protein